jgi:hypothetical protein
MLKMIFGARWDRRRRISVAAMARHGGIRARGHIRAAASRRAGFPFLRHLSITASRG